MKKLVGVELLEPRFVEIDGKTFEVLFDEGGLVANNSTITAIDKPMNQPYAGSFVITGTEYHEDEGYSELSLSDKDVESIIRHFGIIQQDNQITPIFIPDKFLAV